LLEIHFKTHPTDCFLTELSQLRTILSEI
jgi:hypothetical protein